MIETVKVVGRGGNFNFEKVNKVDKVEGLDDDFDKVDKIVKVEGWGDKHQEVLLMFKNF